MMESQNSEVREDKERGRKRGECEDIYFSFIITIGVRGT